MKIIIAYLLMMFGFLLLVLGFSLSDMNIVHIAEVTMVVGVVIALIFSEKY